MANSSGKTLVLAPATRSTIPVAMAVIRPAEGAPTGPTAYTLFNMRDRKSPSSRPAALPPPSRDAKEQSAATATSTSGSSKVRLGAACPDRTACR